MKLQYLAVIFIIIIMPIEIVLSQYIDYQIDAINLKHTYNTKLLDATYDSIKAYQLNTVNNAISDIPASKIEDLEAAVKAFFNSLTTNFNYDGYNSSIMKDYVPAVVFTMYDGYYIYSPYQNILTGVPREQGNESYVDDEYQDNKIIQGIKPYVYYSCRYINENKYDVVITYTLDNYITIQGNVKLDGNGDGSPDGYINKSGYLIDGIEKKEEDTYIYDNIEFTNTKTEKLTEFLGPTSYSYAKINGTKYYLSNDKIFHISSTGEERVSYVEGNPGYKE